jgi:hypothetical protein
MSKIALSGNASGTGTLTIAAPNTSTDRTLTLPDATGTILTTATAGVPVNGPAFSAYRSTTQSLSANTTTKIQFDSEEFDTNSCFDSTTNYRFTPTVAGYYQVSAGLAASAVTILTLYIYKNGSVYKIPFSSNSATVASGGVSALVYCNGSTDYIEIYGQFSATLNAVAGSQYTYFQAAMVRSAT